MKATWYKKVFVPLITRYLVFNRRNKKARLSETIKKSVSEKKLEKVRAHVIIEGRVQGVFFRAYTQDEARLRKVTGWVKNRYDGKVEAVFEGEKNAVNALVDWCHTGSPHASVKNVEVRWEHYQGEFSSFAVTA